MSETERTDRDVTDYKVWRYQKDLPGDKGNLEKAWKLLENYSGVPPDRVEEHVRTVREKAYEIFPYACIGRWRFLDLYLTNTPYYPEILQRVGDGDILLDAGCCFGQVLRQLAFDGVPSKNLRGADLRQEFIDLGYELFLDRDKFEGQFFTGNMLDTSDTSLDVLNGTVDIIHAASFFHLFGWDDQVKLGERIVKLFKPDSPKALLVGRQVGNPQPKDHAEHTELGLGRYHHNPETLQKLWDLIGEKTSTKWKVNAEIIDLIPDSDVPRIGIRFYVEKQ